jgi:hypothetical protein
VKKLCTDLLESARTIEPFVTQLATVARTPAPQFISSRGQNSSHTGVFSLSRLVACFRLENGCKEGAKGKGALSTFDCRGEDGGAAAGDDDDDARRWRDRWAAAVGNYRGHAVREDGDAGQRRKMKFHKRSIARDEERGGDEGGRREWACP